MGDGPNTATAPELATDPGSSAALETRLAAEIAERERLYTELGVRNCALDAAASHFIIGDATRPGWPVVYVNRAIVQADPVRRR